MKILMVSDTHGRVDRVVKVAQDHGDFDLIMHLGDYERDQEDIMRQTGLDVLGVAGNCDWAHTTEECSKVATLECGKVFLTHGHTLRVAYDKTNLYLAAKEAGAVMACYGHTHVAFYDESGDVRILCPGSRSSPRDGTNGTYAIINTDDGHLECRLFEYGKGPLMIDAFGHAKTRPKKRGGFLRRTFNDSDGQ